MTKPLLTFIGAAVAIAALFWLAGSFAWWNLWVFLIFMAVLSVFTNRLVQNSPGLAEERRTAAAKAKPWDLKLVRLLNLALPAMLLVAALDQRLSWTPAVPTALSIAAFIGLIPAAWLTYRAMAANAFFSSHVRIQTDRDHTVTTKGPYGVVRHPGYTGSLCFNLLAPLALGSWLALLIGVAAGLLLVYRTGREDATLTAELPGYAAYAQQVRYRLIPGVW